MTETVSPPPLVISWLCPKCKNVGIYLAPCPIPGIPQQIVPCDCGAQRKAFVCP